MLQYDFENSVGYWLVRTAHACERALSEELAPEGITYRQAQVLGWLVLEGELTQNDLAERMRIEPPTLVGILDRMEREGWIARHSCSVDRRRKWIRPGHAAEPIWERITAKFRRVRMMAVKGFTEHDVQLLKSLLMRVQENLGAAIESDTAVPAVSS
jgi:MarR family transcriptional regulator for hemolysin